MHVIPVLDVRGGIVVGAVGGRRSEYKPLVSLLTIANDPLSVARAIRACYGLDELYVADLDAISGADPCYGEFRRLRDDGFRLWVDAGIRVERDIRRLGHFVDRVVAGSETLEEMPPHDLAPQIVFSQDLRNGQPLGRYGFRDAIRAGIRCVLVIDLARVGVANGVGTESWAREIVTTDPNVEVYVGGGIRDRADIERLSTIGVAGVLVASALHDGRIKGEPGAQTTGARSQ